MNNKKRMEQLEDQVKRLEDYVYRLQDYLFISLRHDFKNNSILHNDCESNDKMTLPNYLRQIGRLEDLLGIKSRVSLWETSDE